MRDRVRPRSGDSTALKLSSDQFQSSNLTIRDLVLLFLLAALWGSVFIFVRITVPETGATFTASLRILVAALALIAYSYAKNVPLEYIKNFTPYMLCGLFGAAIPFFLFAYAAPYLPAATISFLNATSPLFCLLFSSLFFAESFTLRKFVGLIVGITGVLILVGVEAVCPVQASILAIVASIVAPACFAISAIAVKRFTHSSKRYSIDPLALAIGSMVVAALILLPGLMLTLPAKMPSYCSLSVIVLMGLLPSAFAQIIFVPLIARMGAMCAMSVAFLVPLFSIVWSYLFLGEGIHLSMMLGGLLVLFAIAIIFRR